MTIPKFDPSACGCVITNGIKTPCGYCIFMRRHAVESKNGRFYLKPKSLPCINEEPVLEYCKSKTGKESERRHVRGCGTYETCTRVRVSALTQTCADCKEYIPSPDYLLKRWRLQDPNNLLTKGPDEAQFNSSYIVFKGRRLLAYRTTSTNGGGLVNIAEMDDNFVPVANKIVPVWHRAASIGREDPRLFIFREKLHVVFTGYDGHFATILYARLDDSFEVEQIFVPRYTKSKDWQKNWAMFEWSNNLYAVYASSPDHVILRLNGDLIEDEIVTPNTFPWTGGHLRGGACPVRVGDRYYHWTHGMYQYPKGHWPEREYTLGLTVFQAEPPFQIIAQVTDPILYASETRPSHHWASVFFACGAVLDNGVWTVSAGLHDKWTEFVQFDADKIDSLLY